jgi:hypothetical protein
LECGGRCHRFCMPPRRANIQTGNCGCRTPKLTARSSAGTQSSSGSRSTRDRHRRLSCEWSAAIPRGFRTSAEGTMSSSPRSTTALPIPIRPASVSVLNIAVSCRTPTVRRTARSSTCVDMVSGRRHPPPGPAHTAVQPHQLQHRDGVRTGRDHRQLHGPVHEHGRPRRQRRELPLAAEPAHDHGADPIGRQQRQPAAHRRIRTVDRHDGRIPLILATARTQKRLKGFRPFSLSFSRGR